MTSPLEQLEKIASINTVKIWQHEDGTTNVIPDDVLLSAKLTKDGMIDRRYKIKNQGIIKWLENAAPKSKP